MTDFEVVQEVTTYPTRAEVAMMLIFMAYLTIILVATIYAATYEPMCISAIMEE